MSEHPHAILLRLEIERELGQISDCEVLADIFVLVLMARNGDLGMSTFRDLRTNFIDVIPVGGVG